MPDESPFTSIHGVTFEGGIPTCISYNEWESAELVFLRAKAEIQEEMDRMRPYRLFRIRRLAARLGLRSRQGNIRNLYSARYPVLETAAHLAQCMLDHCGLVSLNCLSRHLSARQLRHGAEAWCIFHAATRQAAIQLEHELNLVA